MIKLFFSIDKNPILCKSDNFRRAAGFTLIEVLVSMVILAIGLLGLASLQALALKNNKDAYLFSQASLLAYEMGDRIKANSIYWGAQTDPLNPFNPIPIPQGGNNCNDPNQACTSDQMAAYDYDYWQNSVLNALPIPTATISRSVDINNPPCTGALPAVCLILTWQRSDQSNSAGLLASQITYRLEVTP